VSEAQTVDGLVVQSRERARIGWHPEISSDPGNRVILTRLGAIMNESRGMIFPSLPAGEDTPVSVFFTQTGHNLSNAFLTYWQHNGGLPVFGYPISEEIAETNPTDGNTYTVQYFERNRYEWHPENPPSYNVQLGLLGVEYARSVSLNPLARVLLQRGRAGRLHARPGRLGAAAVRRRAVEDLPARPPQRRHQPLRQRVQLPQAPTRLRLQPPAGPEIPPRPLRERLRGVNKF